MKAGVCGFALCIGILGLMGCGEEEYLVDLALGSDGTATLLWGAPVRAIPEIPCVHDAHGLDPTGSHAEWFSKEGVQVVLTGWAKPATGSISDRCWLMTQVAFASLDDWNSYLPFWMSHLANNLSNYEDSYFFKAPTPGTFQATSADDGSISISIGTEVFVGMETKYDSFFLHWPPPEWRVGLRITAPCPLASVSPAQHSDMAGDTAVFHLSQMSSLSPPSQDASLTRQPLQPPAKTPSGRLSTAPRLGPEVAMNLKQVGLAIVLGLFLVGGGPEHDPAATPEAPPEPLPVVTVVIRDSMPLLGAFQSVARSAGVTLWVDPDLFYACNHQPGEGDEQGQYVCTNTLEHLVTMDVTASVEHVFDVLASQMGGAEVTTEWRDGGWSVFVSKAPPATDP